MPRRLRKSRVPNNLPLPVSALTWFYRAYGLSLAANRQIPSLLPLSVGRASVEPMDLQIWFESIPRWLEDYLASPQTVRYISPYLNEVGQPALVIWLLADGSFYRLHYEENIDYILSADGARLWIRWSKSVTESDIISYLLGPVMGFVLRVRGVVCLHASAVVINRSAAIFVGDAFAGKSTIAMAMGRLGYPIISDDIVPIYENEGVTYAQSGYPRVRLRQASCRMLSDINPALPPLPKGEAQKRLHFDLTTDGYQFQPDPLPVGALYLLANRNEDPRAPQVKSLSPLDGLMGLVANTYVSRFLNSAMRAQELQELSQLVNRVGVRKVHPHQEPSRLAMLCKTILEDIGRHA